MGVGRLTSSNFQGEGMSMKPSRGSWVAICVAALLLGMVQGAFAQQVYGSIYGTVTDQSGAGVPNAKVTITDQEKGSKSEVTTNEVGNYTKDRLIPGMYTVE